MPNSFRNVTHQHPRRHWLVALAATALAVPVGLGVLWAAYFTWVAAATLPDLDEAPLRATPDATVIYAAGGTELTRYFRRNRTPVRYGAISPHVIHALVATEDRRFFSHPGVDFARIASAAVHTLLGDRQGGSTITMQLARNRYAEIGRSPPFVRKLKEILMALRIERHYSKREILESYLNTVPFGHRAFGIAAAAQVYFSKSPRALNVLEGATLVGMLKGPTRYDPVRHPERAQRRRNVVLRQMVEAGYLSESFYTAHRADPVVLHFAPPGLGSSLAPHFAEYVRRQVEDWAARHGYNLYTDGLQVYTTLNVALQRAARLAVRAQLPALQAVAAYEWSRPHPPLLSHDTAPYVRHRSRHVGSFDPFSYLWKKKPALLREYARETARYRRLVRQGTPPDAALTRLLDDAAFVDSLEAAHARLEAGLVAIDPRSGAIRAWIGARNFARDQWDHVALARRQPGSTFKPFVWAAALARGYAPADTFPAAGTPYTLRRGLAFSSNRLALHLIRTIGPAKVARLAHRLGVRSDLRAVPSLALGTSEVTLLEMTSAYATLAAYGVYHRPYAITRIEDGAGNVLARFGPSPKPVFPRYAAYTVVDLMRGVVNYGTGRDLRQRFGLTADLAGKTGTTDGNADGWFLAMHPQLVTGAWVGFNDRRIHFRSTYWGHGSSNALRVVGAFLKRAFARDLLASDVRFMPPPGYRAPQPYPRADTAVVRIPGGRLRHALAAGLDSARSISPRNPLTRRAAHPAAAFRRALRPVASDTARLDADGE